MNYFLHGSEQYLLKKKLAEIVSEYPEADRENMAFYDGTATDFSIERVLEDVNTISLFATQKIVVVRNPLFLCNAKYFVEAGYLQLEAYLKNASTFSSLIFWLDEEAYPADSKLKSYKLLQKECRNVVVKALDVMEFRQLVSSDLKTMKIDIDADAKEALLERLPVDIANWKNEAEKLSLYGQPIHKNDIRFLITRSLEDNAFALSDAVMRKNLKKAMNVWLDLSAAKEEPVKLIGLLASNFRTLYQCLILSMKLDENRIAEYLEVKPGRVYNALKNRGRFSSSRALRLLNDLADLDQRIKSGRINKELGFELFLIEATRS